MCSTVLRGAVHRNKSRYTQSAVDPATAILLLAGTAALTYVSRRSLAHRRSHGFFRFFAFEGILLLVLLNMPYWFDEPTSGRQVLSWLLLLSSLVLAVHTFSLFHRLGQPPTAAVPGQDFRFEQTSRLVDSGIYRFIRHPMYVSLLWLGSGAFLKHITLLTTCILILIVITLYATARTEEQENLKRFGQSYRDYVLRTRMFIPFLW
ncbi:MAG TPA: protein-S-isoprenylcysteine methyltransferase [Bacteroidetes bacterium]|nr:protein-S-isoprenylcysteine methyltransferase [Bacteroidota bacterium]